MDLSSLNFIFIFLPVFLIIYLVADRRSRLPIILVANVIFLVWGQPVALWWLGSILVMGYTLGRAIELAKDRKRDLLLWLGLAILLLLLALVKSLTAFGVDKIASVLPPAAKAPLTHWVTPVGLSYVGLQMIGYLVDVARGTIPAEKNFLYLATYVFFFPKLVSGPLVRYKPFADQLNQLEPTLEQTASGIRRILQGFCKRILLANQLALVANAAFGLPTPNLAPHLAWLALAAYTLQIYFDFSGYTDMALGLGQMMGIRLPENFDNPYLAQSLSDFWRRWHISLSTWFREYVFFPLERYRLPYMGQPLNIMLVFLLTGLWHGFTLPFIAWGLLHGLAVALESAGLGRQLKNVWRPLRHLYSLMIILLGWVFFRSSSLTFATGFLRRLAGDTSGLTPLVFSQSQPLPFIEPSFILVLIVSTILILPLGSLWKSLRTRFENLQPVLFFGFQSAEDLILIAIFIVSLAAYLTGRFAPNIYAKF